VGPVIFDEGPPGGAWLPVLLLADDAGRNEATAADEAEETGAAVAEVLNTPLIFLSSLLL
jgi:hypothetical protein